MIRQAISCDICGTDKQQTNHWFIAFDQGAELRISGFNAKDRFRSGAKHLCGQTCLHKLVDEFMARTIAKKTPAAETATPHDSKTQPATAIATRAVPTQNIIRGKQVPAPAQRGAGGILDTSLTSAAAHVLPTPVSPLVHDFDEFESSAVLIPSSTTSARLPDAAPAASPPASKQHVLHADAWKREREREQRANPAGRRRSIA